MEVIGSSGDAVSMARGVDDGVLPDDDIGAGMIPVGGKLLRCGFTTGTCAAAAAAAAARLLITGAVPPVSEVQTPAGISARIHVEDFRQGPGWAECAVRKRSGDDPDITDGCMIWARVEGLDHNEVIIEGGEGVGRVTKPGLDQPVGEAAINSVPRRMIHEAVRSALDDAGEHCGAAVTISIPDGVRLASKTFNPRLGIEGGISVLGTSGIVRPMSEEALVTSIQLEMSVMQGAGVEHLLVAPGNYGRDYAEQELGIPPARCLQCSNYIGAVLDEAARLGFSSLLVVGHIGKMAKVAAGIMNTHSKVADARLETISAHAAMSGADRDCIEGIMNSPTTDAALDILEEAGLVEPTIGSMTDALERVLARRAGEGVETGAIVFSKERGFLSQTKNAEMLLERIRFESNLKEER